MPKDENGYSWLRVRPAFRGDLADVPHAGRSVCGAHGRADGRALARPPAERACHPASVTVAVVILLLMHTRTALVSLVAGLLVAGLRKEPTTFSA